MILSALISLLAWIITGVSTLLPNGTLLPANFADLITDILTYIWAWDWLLPVGTILTIASTAITFTITVYAWNAGKYLIALLRGN